MARILVIDDEEVQCRLLACVLHRSGFEVQYATDGDQGLKMQHAQPAELVLLDLVMPNRCGVEVMSMLRQAYSRLSIIIITAGRMASDSEAMAMLVDLGAEAILTKPFTVDELLSAVEQALGSELFRT